MVKRNPLKSIRRRKRLGLVSTPKSEPPKTPSKVHVVAYDKENFTEEAIQDVRKLKDMHDKNKVLWVDVEGTEDHDLLRLIGEQFDVHRINLEAVINVHRSKLVQFHNHYFLVLEQMHSTSNLVPQQISVAIGNDHIVTFHDGAWKEKDGIIERIKNGIGSIRTQGADYLVYAIVDSVIDSYFPVLEATGEHLEDLETEIIDSPRRQTIADVHAVKRDLLTLRRALWPIREAINTMVRDCTQTFSEETIIHLRDCYDHAVQLIDFIETYRELGSDLMDVYLSSISNRMNEVMKVLTIITTIFVPPTFIAGIYGMNFKPEVSPWNMPETKWYYGYEYCLGLMAFVAIIIVGMLWWKGWLGALSPMKNRVDTEK